MLLLPKLPDVSLFEFFAVILVDAQIDRDLLDGLGLLAIQPMEIDDDGCLSRPHQIEEPPAKLRAKTDDEVVLLGGLLELLDGICVEPGAFK